MQLPRAPPRGSIPAGGSKRTTNMLRFEGIGGFILLVADVWAIVNILQSGKGTGDKVLWTVLVLVLPLLGFILWLLFGPKTGRA
jgi:hypothetical protein